jgi:hypothetical protein
MASPRSETKVYGSWAAEGWTCNCTGESKHNKTGKARCRACGTLAPTPHGLDFWHTSDASASVAQARLDPDIKSVEQIVAETEALLEREGLGWQSARLRAGGARVLKPLLPEEIRKPNPTVRKGYGRMRALTNYTATWTIQDRDRVGVEGHTPMALQDDARGDAGRGGGGNQTLRSLAEQDPGRAHAVRRYRALRRDGWSVM